MRYSEICLVRANTASVIFSGAGPPLPALYFMPKSPCGPAGLWLAVLVLAFPLEDDVLDATFCSYCRCHTSSRKEPRLCFSLLLVRDRDQFFEGRRAGTDLEKPGLAQVTDALVVEGADAVAARGSGSRMR